MRDRLFRTDLKRCLFSIRFIAVITAMAAICSAGCAEIIPAAIKNQDKSLFSSLGEIERMLTFDKYKCVMAAILAALYAGSFVDDRKHNYLRCVLSRVSLERYVICRLGSIWIGTVLACILGFGLMCICLNAVGVMGFRIIIGNMTAMRFLPLASGKYAFLYLILLGCNFGTACAVVSVLGMWLSVYRKERFLAIGGAVLAFYFMYAFSNFLPPVISYEVIGSRFNQDEFATNTGVVLYHAAYLGILFCMAGTLFYISVKRRWNRGELV